MLNAKLEERGKKRVEKRAVKFTAGFDTRTKKLCDKDKWIIYTSGLRGRLQGSL